MGDVEWAVVLEGFELELVAPCPSILSELITNYNLPIYTSGTLVGPAYNEWVPRPASPRHTKH